MPGKNVLTEKILEQSSDIKVSALFELDYHQLKKGWVPKNPAVGRFDVKW